MKNNNRILVFGASGFIGRNLLNSIPNSQGVSMRDENWSRDIYGSEVFINLVGKAHDHKGQATFSDYEESNVITVKELFNNFLISSASLFIHISSIAAVEEFEADIPIDELHENNVESYYGITKRDAEIWLLKQVLPEGKKIVILRPPMVHGPGDKGNLSLLYKFISKGIPYPLAAFENNRTFISIPNFNFIINRIISDKNLIRSGIYNISDDQPLSTKDIVFIIKSETKLTSMDIKIPKFVVKFIASIGEIIPLPINKKRLKKLTSNLLVSNTKIKKELQIDSMPLSAQDGMKLTIKSFANI